MTMPILEFYFSPGACSLVSLIALEEAGAIYTSQPILLSRGEHKKPDYLALNPKGKVPLLVLDGQQVTENVAILTALSKLYPEAGLLPKQDVMAEVRALSMLAWCASGLHPYITRLCMPQFICDDAAAAPRIQAMAADMLTKNLAILEGQLEGRDWFLREWSAVDAYLFWIWRRIQGAPIDTAAFSRLASHHQRMLARPSVMRALALEQSAA
jgi:glutathione S-transferase